MQDFTAELLAETHHDGIGPLDQRSRADGVVLLAPRWSFQKGPSCSPRMAVPGCVGGGVVCHRSGEPGVRAPRRSCRARCAHASRCVSRPRGRPASSWPRASNVHRERRGRGGARRGGCRPGHRRAARPALEPRVGRRRSAPARLAWVLSLATLNCHACPRSSRSSFFGTVIATPPRPGRPIARDDHRAVLVDPCAGRRTSKSRAGLPRGGSGVIVGRRRRPGSG